MQFKKTNQARFNRYLYKYWKLQTVVIALGLIAVPLSLLGPYLIKLVIDKAYANKDLKLFLILAIIGGSIFILNGLLQSLNNFLSQRISRSVTFDMAKDIFKHLQSLPISFFNNESTSRHIYMIDSDVTSVSSFVCDTIPKIITLVPRLLFILVIVFYLSWKVMLFIVLLVPIVYLRSKLLGKWLKEMMRRIIENSQGICMELYEVFSHIRLVKAFGKESYEIKRYEENLLKIMDFENKNAKLSSISSLSSSILDKLITGIIALYGGYQVIKGGMTLGSLTAVMIYSPQLIGIINSIGGIYEAIQINSISRQRLTKILDIQPEIKDKENAIAYENLQGRMEFRGVCFGYKEGELILSSLNFSISAGSKIALVGQSGCGKTTLLSLILRLYEPTEGSILVDNLDVRDIKLESLKAQIGVALQESFLWNDTVANNIRYGKEEATFAEIENAAKVAQIHQFIASLPKGYDTNIGELACKISEGQKQRLAIARAVIRKPAVIILDEAMSSLDSQTEERIIDNLKSGFRTSTLIVVSHRLSTAINMDSVYFLKAKDEMKIGSHQQLLEQEPDYRRLFASQIESRETYKL